MVENVFVLGLDAHNARVLHGLPDAAPLPLPTPLLSDGELAGGESVDLPGLLDAAQRQVEAFDGPVHALVGFWDFPVSTMVPILCERLGLRWATLEAVVKCEHKYWSRLEQAKVIDEIPGFGLLDPDDPVLPDGMAFPVWLKPIRSASSELAFRADDPQQLADAADTIRRGMRRIGDAFGTVLDLLDLPPELAGVGGSACLVEEAATGRLVTVEGYSHRGEVRVYGVVDSVTVSGGTSFVRYQYPSTVPVAVADRMTELTRRVIERIGFDGTTFNVEYFWDAERDALDAAGDQPASFAEPRRAVRLGGRRREPPSHAGAGAGQGAAAAASRGPLRGGGQVVRATLGRRCGPPGADGRRDRAGRAGAVDGCVVEVTVEHRASACRERHDQDSYSYAIANVYVGGASEDELIRKYEQCRRRAAVRDRGRRRPGGPHCMRIVDRFPHEVVEEPAADPDVGRDAPRGRGSGGPRPPRRGPCRRSWSSSPTGSAT